MVSLASRSGRAHSANMAIVVVITIARIASATRVSASEKPRERYTPAILRAVLLTNRFCARREDFSLTVLAFVTSRVLLPRVFFAGEKVPKADEGAALGRSSLAKRPHAHFVSPSPRKTRGEGLSIGKILWLRLCRAVASRCGSRFRVRLLVDGDQLPVIEVRVFLR